MIYFQCFAQVRRGDDSKEGEINDDDGDSDDEEEEEKEEEVSLV